MKRMMSVFCLLLTVLVLSACGSPAPSLREHGISLIATLDELAENEECIAIYSGNPEINEIISGAAANHEAPKAVFAVTVPDSLAEIPSGVSAELRSFLSRRTLSALSTQLNATGGTTTLAASTICTVSKTFTAPDAKNSIYFYVYEDAVPVAVTFTMGENDTVSATATYVLASGLTLETAQDIQNLFADIPVEVASVTE